jgi:hypothetical protein
MFRKAMVSDDAALSLDFTTGVLDSRLTFTRSTTGTYINSSGYVTSAAINAPRFDYDPTTLTPRGLLIEGSASNLVLQSDTLPTPTNWVANSIVRTNVSAVTPDGNTTATTCGLSHTGSGSFRSQTVTVVASTTYTFSFWAKNNGGSVALYRAYNASGSADIVAETSYFTQINSSTWTRVQFTFTTPVGCTSVYVYPLSQASGTSNLLIWGAQLEAGSGASSYIPTAASQGSRAADSCVMTGANFSSWFTLGPGTVLAHQDFTKNNTRNLVATISNGGTTYIEMGYRAVGHSTEAIGYNNAGALTFTSTAFTPTINTAYKSAYVWEPGVTQLNVCANGTFGTAASSPVTGAMDRLVLGADATSPTDSYIKNGHIRSLKYWPTRLPNAQLQALTT